MATSPGPPPPTSCLLLDKLAAELRNNIWELAFATEDVEEVDFFAAAPPNKALLLTCRQIYKEARQIHREAYRRYWRSSKFHLDAGVEQSDLVCCAWPSQRDITEVCKLRLNGQRGRESYVFNLIDQRGIWKYSTLTDEGDHFVASEEYLIVMGPGVGWAFEQDVATAAARLRSNSTPSPLWCQIDDLVLFIATPRSGSYGEESIRITERQIAAVRLWISNRTEG